MWSGKKNQQGKKDISGWGKKTVVVVVSSYKYLGIWLDSS